MKDLLGNGLLCCYIPCQLPPIQTADLSLPEKVSDIRSVRQKSDKHSSFRRTYDGVIL